MLEVSLDNISPTSGAASVSGTGASYFDWTYVGASNTLEGEQNATIPGNLFAGNVDINFTVISDTEEANPLNGFEVNLLPSASILASNNVDNDFISSKTWAGSDLTDIATFLPNTANGITDHLYTIRVQELNNVNTEGAITVVMPKDVRFVFTYDGAATNIGPFPVSNASWTYNGGNPTFHIWSYNGNLTGLTSSTFGFEVVYDPQNTSGEVSYTSTILSGSGSENDFLNNIDVETLDYFSQ